MTAVLVLDSWAGRERIPVEVVGETRTRYRVRLMQNCRLPGRKWHDAGEVILVPKYAVKQQQEVTG